jgi:dTDP-4-amino-4,6-dideoxygalactose transaminase
MNIISHSRPFIGKEEALKASAVVSSGKIAAGKEVETFETAMSVLTKTRYASAVSSGSAALYLALLALKIKENDEVIIPSYVCTAVLNAVLLAKAKPVLADSSAYDFNISAEDIKRKLTRRTKAIIVPHLFGFPADIKRICSYGIPVIEDCAQTVSAGCYGKKTGQWGELSIYSFYATKPFAAGEGGMVLSNNKAYVDFVRDYIDYDEKKDLKPRFNFKMTDIQASIGRVQLDRFPDFIKQRIRIAKQYSQALKDKQAVLPSSTIDKEHLFFRYVIGNVTNLDKKINAFQKNSIMARKPIFIPLHHYLKKAGFPVCEKAWRSCLSLPIYPNMTETDIARVIKTAQEIL